MAKRGTALSPEQQADYRREVSRVNKQLYRLEKHYEKTGGNIMATAYKGIIRDIKAMFGEQKRFSKSMPATVREYQKRMNAIRRFYEKPSSTITGAKNVFQKRAESISAKANANVTSEQLMALFETGLFKQLVKDTFGYVTGVKAIGRIQRQGERILRDLEQGKKITFLGRGAGELNRQLEADPQMTGMLERYLRDAIQ